MEKPSDNQSEASGISFHAQLSSVTPITFDPPEAMVDPISISSATVGFVAFALQVATTAAQFIRDATGFPNEFVKLCLATNEFAILLQRLYPSFVKIEERYDAEGIAHSILFYTDMLVEDKTDILMRCWHALNAIDELLKSFKGSNSNSTSTPLQDRITEPPPKKQRITASKNAATQPHSNNSFQDRINWAFSKKKRIGELFSQLEQCKSTLGLAFANELLYQSCPKCG